MINFRVYNEKSDFHQLKEILNNNEENKLVLLFNSIIYSQEKTASHIIDSGLDINKKYDNGFTPLHLSVEYNLYDLTNKILSQGGNPNIKNDFGNTSLWIATFNCKGKNYNMVELLLKFKANPMQKNNYGRSPLDFAVQINDKKLINLLKSHIS